MGCSRKGLRPTRLPRSRALPDAMGGGDRISPLRRDLRPTILYPRSLHWGESFAPYQWPHTGWPTRRRRSRGGASRPTFPEATETRLWRCVGTGPAGWLRESGSRLHAVHGKGDWRFQIGKREERGNARVVTIPAPCSWLFSRRNEFRAPCGGEGAIVGQVFLGSVTAGVEQDRAEFERGIVGDAELPIRRKIPHGVLQITVHHRERIGDPGRVGLVGLKPAFRGNCHRGGSGRVPWRQAR